MPKDAAVIDTLAEQTLAVRTEQEHAIARIDRQDGAMKLAMMSTQDFEQRLKFMKLGQERMEQIIATLLDEGEDYGKVPGTKKNTLLKPGSEKLMKFCGLVATFQQDVSTGDGERTPDLSVMMTCSLHQDSTDGPIVAQGVGAANSFEKKYRYRAAQRACPSCGCEGTIRRSGFEDRETGDKGWYCNGRAGGCGGKFHSTDKAIIEQQGGQVDNPDPYDVENTLLKMAAKRSQIDAVLRYTATSGLMTQDVEDVGAAALDAREKDGGGGKPAVQGQKPAQEARSTAGAAQTSTERPATQGNGTGQAADGKVTQAQIRGFWVRVGKSGVGVEDVAARIRDRYKVASSTELTVAQLADMDAWIIDPDGGAREPGSDG